MSDGQFALANGADSNIYTKTCTMIRNGATAPDTMPYAIQNGQTYTNFMLLHCTLDYPQFYSPVLSKFGF
jgi:hypothetical protein